MEKESGKRFSLRQLFEGDGMIWGIMIFLCFASMMLIYSAASGQLFDLFPGDNEGHIVENHHPFVIE